MSFLNPAMLLGLVAVGVPVAIHFINKIPVRKTYWAAMRFLLEAEQKNRSRSRLEDLLLLILRCLFVAFVVLAFARPAWKTLVEGSADEAGPVAAVVLLDNSASMGQSDGSASRIDQGKKAIRDWLGRAPMGSLLGLSLISDRVVAMIAQPGTDTALFRRNLDLAETNERATDLARGIRSAYETLKPIEGRPREIHIYTDSQVSAWRNLDEVRKLQQQNPDIRLKPVILGEKGEDNLAVTGLFPEGGVPAASQPCRFRVEVANYGSAPVTGVKVNLAVDGDPPSDDTLIPRIEPGAKQSVNLFARFGTPGPHAVTATIPPDRLAVDNQRTSAVQVVDRLNVLIVESSPDAPPVKRDGFFLRNALLPVSFDRVDQYYLKVAEVPAAQLATAPLATANVVFLANPGDISNEAAKVLKDYVAQGGNLVVFPGPKSKVSAWKKNRVFSDLLPASIDEAKSVPGKGIGWQSEGFVHPVSTLWNDPSQGSLGSIRLSKYFPLIPKPENQPGEGNPPVPRGKPGVIVNLAGAEAAVVEWKYGLGRVVLFSGPATSEWSNLPLHPSFVPFVQRLMGYLSRGNEQHLILAPGERYQMPVSIDLLGKEFSVIRPGKDQSKRVAGRVELEGQEAVVRFRDTEKAGPYRIFIAQEENPSAVFAVQMDPTESDLREAPRADIEALAAEPAREEGAKPAMRLEVKSEYWGIFMALAALVFVLEGALAHRFSQAR